MGLIAIAIQYHILNIYELWIQTSDGYALLTLIARSIIACDIDFDMFTHETRGGRTITRNEIKPNTTTHNIR
jgi:hypothetical protein